MSPSHRAASASAALLAASALLANACDGDTTASTRDRSDSAVADATADAAGDARDAKPDAKPDARDAAADARDAAADARDAAPPIDARPCEASAECQPETDAEADPCSVHECAEGRCVVRPPSTQTGCWAPFSDGSKRVGICWTEAPFCNPCWGPYEWSPDQSCRRNPACCWATHDEFAWPMMRCFGSCVDGLCVQPDGGCEMWY